MPASLIGYKAADTARPFGDRELQILRVLHPVFEAAVQTLKRFRSAAHELASCFDQMPTPALLIGNVGLVQRNIAFSRTFKSNADSIADAVTLQVQELLGHGHKSASRLVAGTVKQPDGRAVPWTVSLLSSLGNDPVALVHFDVVQRVSVTDETRERFRLTPRQAAVAELMADGRTYREIAAALGIRPNTARRHWEHVLEKLGIRSRRDIQTALSRHNSVAIRSLR